MNLTFIPPLFFTITAFLLLRRGVEKIRWTTDIEKDRASRVIDEGMVPTIMRYFRSNSILDLCIVIGSYDMSNRIVWWVLAGVMALFNLGGLMVSRTSTDQELKAGLISEDDDLEKTVRNMKIAGAVFLAVLAGWLMSGLQYFPVWAVASNRFWP